MSMDPVVSNTDQYKVDFENEQVRVLQCTDTPGDKTIAHAHPNSVIYAVNSFRSCGQYLVRPD